MIDFSTPEMFSYFLIQLAAKEALATRAALQLSAKLVKKTARDEIGHLQPAAGPFPAWAELADSTKKDKERQGYKINDEYNPLLRDGTLRDSYEYRTTHLEAVIGSKMDIAAYQELGTKTIPSRPVLGPALFNNKEKIREIIGHTIMAELFGSGKKITTFVDE